jgi:hypothetical protein
MNGTSRHESNSSSASYDNETNFQQQQRKDGLTTKIRQTFNVAGKRGPSSRARKPSAANLTNLTPQSQVRCQTKERSISVEIQ